MQLNLKAKTAIGVGIVALAAAYVQLVPAQSWYQCPIHATTGIYCPGCGGQRWFASLLHGDFAAAWNYNQLLSLSPLIALAYFGIIKLKPGLKTHAFLIGVLLLGIIGFVVWRNFEPQVGYLSN